jgi:hypothetical protein
MNLATAMKNPSATFGTPEAIEASTEFTNEQKRAILQQWKDQLDHLQTTSNESMLGPESNGSGAECMRRVVNALIRLDAEATKT